MARFARRRLKSAPKSAPAAHAARKPPAVEGTLGIPQWTDLIKEFPDYTQAYVERGILLYKTGRYDNALYDFNVALKLVPNEYKALFYRGCTYMSYRKFKEAVADFKRCLHHEQGNAEACYYCAF